MNWNVGYSSTYYLSTVDKVTWRDINRIEITDGSITRSEEALRCSAQVGCVDFDQSREHWVRIWLDARQNDETVHIPLFTGLTSSPNKQINGALTTNQVQCYSVLKPCEDILLPRGWYAPEGVRGTTIIKQLLLVTPAPVVVDENAPALQESIVAEEGESNLTMIDKILTAINWRMRIQGDGTIEILPKAIEHNITYDPLENDALEPEIEVEYDWYSAPNVFRAIADGVAGEARDESEESNLSIANRGREVWMQETSCELNVGETAEDYARRRLKEVQRIALKVSYNRRFNPDLLVTDLVGLHYPKQEVDGAFYIRSQQIELQYGARTSEEVILS